MPAPTHVMEEGVRRDTIREQRRGKGKRGHDKDSMDGLSCRSEDDMSWEECMR